ncbi:MAG: hypothetical protein JXM69_20155 [Anaerolineae bacterium]|nr:hypothetical protein [Anaerolineae bacterium]
MNLNLRRGGRKLRNGIPKPGFGYLPHHIQVKPTQLLFFAVVILALTLPTLIILAQDFPDVCLQPESLLPNCGFDNGLDRWQSFTEDGSAAFSVLQGGGECHAPRCPAAYIVTESFFIGGIYQQVPVAAGNTYYANIVWLTFDSLVNDASINQTVGGGIGRRIGIDPLGGTDPRSPNIVWGPDNWRNDCKICENQTVIATAQADTITIFIRLEDTWRLRAAEKGFQVPPSKDQFWLDDVGLKQIAGDAVPLANPTESPPTDTPPPTATPQPESPTSTPVPATDTPTVTPEEVAQTELTPDVGSVSPLNTPTAKAVVAPPTLTPTATSLPPPTLIPRPSPVSLPNRHPTAAPVASSIIPLEFLGVAGTTICVGGVALLMMAVVVAGLVWLYRLGWGNVDHDETDDFGDDDIDDGEPIVVEIVEDED